MLDKKGFTLVELVVTMGIFITVMVLSSFVFEKVIGQAAQRSKSMEGQTEGVVGLETFRTDLESAGYGLPFSIISSAKKLSYSEAIDSPNFPVSGINRKNLNDAPTGAPRGVVGINGDDSIGFNKSDYLVIKSALVGQNDTAKKSSRINYELLGADPSGKILNSGTNDLQPGERAIVLKSTFEGGKEKRRELVIDGISGDFFVTVSSTNLPTAFSPLSPQEIYFAYGLDPSNSTPLRMPFNRADYFVMRPSGIPKSCNSGAGVLYKATTNHNNGGITYYPLVDCIGDMQVVYSLDVDNDGVIGTYSNADGSQISSAEGVSIIDVVQTLSDPKLIRERLKEIQVYILAQVGSMDKNFSYPDSTIVVGDAVYASLGRTWSASDMAATFGTHWRNYHWKVYKITANSRNMQQ